MEHGTLRNLAVRNVPFIYGSAARAALACVFYLLTFLALWFVARRWSGHLSFASSSVLLASVAGLVLVTAVARGLERWSAAWVNSRTSRGQDRSALFSLPLIVATAAFSSPATLPWTTAIAWLLVAGEELFWWRLAGGRGDWPSITPQRSPNAMPPTETRAEAEQTLAEPAEQLADDEGDSEDESAELLPANVSQQLIREQTATGEIVSGLVRCRFAAHEQTQNVHLAFCPPLDTIPNVTAHQLTGPAAQLKIGTAQTYGTRIELRLAHAQDEPTEVILQMEAASNFSPT